MFSCPIIYTLNLDPFSTQNGVRENTTVSFNTALGIIFSVKKYADILLDIVKEKNIQVSIK